MEQIKTFKLSNVQNKIEEFNEQQLEQAKEYFEKVSTDEEWEELEKWAIKHRWNGWNMKDFVMHLKKNRLIKFITDLKDNMTAMAFLNYCYTRRNSTISSILRDNYIAQ